MRKFLSVLQNSPDHCAKIKVQLPVKPDAKPKFFPKSPAPYSVLELVDQELKRLLQAGIIQPVNYCSWTAAVVVLKKANQAIHMCQYSLPVPDDQFVMHKQWNMFLENRLF